MPEEIEVTQIDPALVKRATRLFQRFGKAKLTLATAESCTGGLIAAILSDAPGAGDLFHGGFVLYTKRHKVAFGIPKKLIDKKRHRQREDRARAGRNRAEAMSRGHETLALTRRFKSQDRGEIRCHATELALKLAEKIARGYT